MYCQRFIKQIALCLLPPFIVGCVGDNVSPGTGDRGTAGLHAVMSEQLTVDAARLNALLFDLHRTETVLARERGEQYRRIGATARSLQEGAAQVRAIGATLTLADDALARFIALAGQLEAQADSLAAGAADGALTPEEMDAQLFRINATCDSCHALYRDSGGRGR